MSKEQGWEERFEKLWPHSPECKKAVSDLAKGFKLGLPDNCIELDRKKILAFIREELQAHSKEQLKKFKKELVEKIEKLHIPGGVYHLTDIDSDDFQQGFDIAIKRFLEIIKED